ncbi:MAG TPA: IS630 family transposase [Planctomycetota bacterium]|nr:IS630 family transposase [Planctomycetota bacterium]
MAAKTMGRPCARLVLTAEERDELRRFVRSRSGAAAMSRRAAIILKCEAGLTDIDVAEELHTTRVTVGKWRRRFEKSRIAGLLDEPRVGAPRKITDEHVERVIRLTLHTKPRKATHWSRRLLARESGFSKDAIGRIWRTFGLQPHRSETFSLSNDPQFIEKVRDVVGLYMSPPSNALVLCVDEKSQMQALDRSQPVLPMQFTTPDRRTHNYIRHGTTSLFAALDIATGSVIGKCFRRHRTTEFVQFLDHIDRSVPDDTAVHLVLDNYVTHKAERVKRWLLRRPRFHLHFTPTHASWLNMVEGWFGLLARRRLARGVHRSTSALERDVRSFIETHNEDSVPYVWSKSADQILEALWRYCHITNGAPPPKLCDDTSAPPH